MASLTQHQRGGSVMYDRAKLYRDLQAHNARRARIAAARERERVERLLQGVRDHLRRAG